MSTAALRRARVATSLLFACVGMVIGVWTARLPAIKHGLDLTDGSLSLALLGFAVGAIIGMQVVARLVDRFGSRRVMLAAAIGDGLMLLAPALSPTLLTLALTMVAFGTGHGILNIAVNANAVEVEQATGRPIMSSFHAVYSIGGFAGAAVGGLCAYADLPVLVTFALVAVVIIGLAGVARPWALAAPTGRAGPVSTVGDPTPADRDGGTDAESPRSGVLMFGLIAFCCLVGEGAAADWSSVYLRDSLGASAGFAAAAYAAFAVAMTAGRLVGDRLTVRFGPVALVRFSALIAVVGLGVALVVSSPVAGVVGFGCLGAGLSGIAPQVFSAAGRRNPRRASHALARVVSIGWLGFVVGPLLIGGLAELTSLPVALGIPVLLAGFVAATATVLGPGRAGTEPPPSPRPAKTVGGSA